MASRQLDFDLIITVVPKGQGQVVLEASRAAGADGGTVFQARGAGIREQKKILGIPVEPEKEVVLTLLPEEMVDPVLDAIVEATDLEKPGHGIALVVDVKKVVGIYHLEKHPLEKDGKDDGDTPSGSA